MHSTRKRPCLLALFAGLPVFTILSLVLLFGGYPLSVAWPQSPAPTAEKAEGKAEGAPTEEASETGPEEQAEPAEGEAEATDEPAEETEAEEGEPSAEGETPASEEKGAESEKPRQAAAAAKTFDWKRALIESVAVLIGSLLAMKALNVAVRRIVVAPKDDISAAGQRARTLAGILISTGRYVIFLVALLMILASFKINIAPILAGVGFVGLAVGFGAQNAVRDLISGFFILFENSFSIGDWVRISAIEGTVEQMGLRSTSIRSYDGTLNIIPNGSITTVSNLTKGFSRAVVDVPLPSTVNFQEASRLLEEVARQSHKEVEGLLEVPQVLGMETLSRVEMSIRLSARVVPSHREQANRELRRRVKEALERTGLGS